MAIPPPPFLLEKNSASIGTHGGPASSISSVSLAPQPVDFASSASEGITPPIAASSSDYATSLLSTRASRTSARSSSSLEFLPAGESPQEMGAPMPQLPPVRNLALWSDPLVTVNRFYDDTRKLFDDVLQRLAPGPTYYGISLEILSISSATGPPHHVAPGCSSSMSAAQSFPKSCYVSEGAQGIPHSNIHHKRKHSDSLFEQKASPKLLFLVHVVINLENVRVPALYKGEYYVRGEASTRLAGLQEKATLEMESSQWEEDDWVGREGEELNEY